MSPSASLKSLLSRVQLVGLVVGLIGLALLAVGAFVSTDSFFQAYLKGFTFWTQVGVGCLGILMIHHVAGGAWSAVIQRLLEAGAHNLVLMAILFTPIIFGMSTLYEWTRPEVLAEDPITSFKTPYLNTPFFLGRTILYFVIWIGLALLLSRISRQQDETGDPALGARLKAISAPGLVMFFLAATFASFDWMMSLEPHWFSSAYGAIFIVGAGAAAFALIILTMRLVLKHEPFSRVVKTQNINDLGNFQLATVMLWAYLAFSQFLIIWSANLAEFTPWYVARINGGWEFISVAMLLFHFVIPFLMLLSRSLKRNPALLSIVALIVLVVARPLESLFLIAPAFHPDGLFIHWLDFAGWLGIGGIWIAAFVWQLKRQPALIPLHDHRLALTKETAHGQKAPSHAH